MTRYNPEIHHRHSIRLPEYDYSNPGTYFVTICTHEKKCLFGSVTDDCMVKNNIGELIEKVWMELQKRFPTIKTDEFIVMPNHVHGIIWITEKSSNGSPTLGSIIRVFKSISAIDANKIIGRSGASLWQRNYYERIIRNDYELYNIREYIKNNPAKWRYDEH